MGRIKDLTGNRYGRLVVMEFAGLYRHRRARWNCVCDCGQMATVTSDHLLSGRQVSCGCRRAEILAKHHERSFPAHGTIGGRIPAPPTGSENGSRNPW